MLSLLGSARVFAYPSNREGFGLTVLEAMALGVPPLLVRTRLNAAVQLAGDGGIAVDRDVHDYANSLASLLGCVHRMVRGFCRLYSE